MSPLQIFPKHPSAPDTYYIGGGWSPACITAVEKRFSPGELAAEYWANEVEAWRMVGYRPEFYDVDRAELLESRADTLRRFCTLPHYDENPA